MRMDRLGYSSGEIMGYKADLQDGQSRSFNSLDHARAYAYHKFANTKRTIPIVIYSPSGKRSGIVMRSFGRIVWRTFTDKEGSFDRRLYENGKAEPRW